MNTSILIKSLIAGLVVGTCIGAVTGCGGVDGSELDDQEQGQSWTTYAGPDGPECDDSELDVEKTVGSAVTNTGIPAGSVRYIAARNLTYKFLPGFSEEAKSWFRLGFADLMAQEWATNKGRTLSEVSAGSSAFIDVTPMLTDGCDENSTDSCNGVLGQAPMNPTSCTTVGSAGGITYKTCNHQGLRLWERTMRDAAKFHMNTGTHEPSVEGVTVDEGYLRANYFYFLAQHELAHVLGVNHSAVPAQSQYSFDTFGRRNLNDQFPPIPGVGTGKTALTNLSYYYLDRCAWDRMKFTNVSSSTTSLGFTPLGSTACTADGFGYQ